MSSDSIAEMCREAEQELLATVIEYPDVFPEVLPLSPDDFSLGAHGTLWGILCDLRSKGHGISVLSVRDALRREYPVGSAAESTLSAYVSNLQAVAKPPIYAADLARMIRERGILRAVRLLHAEMAERIDADDPSLIALARRMGIAASGAGETGVTQATPASALVPETFNYLEDIWEGRGARPLPTGLSNLDALGGFIPGDFVLIGARPSTGKTALGVQMARHASLAGRKTLIVSLEMHKKQLMVRMFAQEANVNVACMSPAWRSGVEEGYREAILSVAGPLSRMPLAILDKGDLTLDGISSLTRATHAREGLDLLVIDYIQLIPTPQSDSGRATRNDELGKISRRLKQIAMELGIVVVAMAQLNRGAAGVRPRISDFRESGNLEQDADTCILLSADLSGFADEQDWERAAQRTVYCDVAKNRNGRRDSLSLLFNSQQQLFVDVGTERV